MTLQAGSLDIGRVTTRPDVDRAYVTKSVWDQVQIYYSAELGIGQADPQMITIEDVKVPILDEIKDNWT